MSDERKTPVPRGATRQPRDTAEELLAFQTRVEHVFVALENRLVSGANTLDVLRTEIKEAKTLADGANSAAIEAARPKATNWRLVIPLIMFAIGGFATLLRMLYTAPSSDDIEEAQKDTTQKIDALKSEIGDVKIEQAKVLDALEDVAAAQVEANKSLEKKVDKLTGKKNK